MPLSPTGAELLFEVVSHSRTHRPDTQGGRRAPNESLGNVTPADAYFGRAAAIIEQRERIKRQTIELRRLQHRKLAA